MATMMTKTRPMVDVPSFIIAGTDDCDDNSKSSVYPYNIEAIREKEYPSIRNTAYLDHAGTTLCAKSAIESFTADLTTSLFGNPHSASASSQLSSQRIAEIRLQVLQFFGADPTDFDVVFVSNATAAIKLVAEAFRDNDSGFWYTYHVDSHTSLVGVRELAEQGSTCFQDDITVQNWINTLADSADYQSELQLFAYPGQSNMTGRQLPYRWCRQIRSASARTGRRIYSLLDAAALASTSPLDLSDSDAAPDFTALSFYKIFGYPDLGALIVRRASSDILKCRKYFAGGTVDAVSACGRDELWHMKKEILHSALEDGTLPFHNIIALGHALATHLRLYGSMRNIAEHTAVLSIDLVRRMEQLKHSNGQPVCKVYGRDLVAGSTYGPVIAFNILDGKGQYISNSEVEKLAIVQNIQFRTGGLCNPGGIAKHLDLSTQEVKENYATGYRCGSDIDLVNDKPTGVIRVSLGAMSCQSDVNKFIKFLQNYYTTYLRQPRLLSMSRQTGTPRFFVEAISIFPIKSCSAFKIPADVAWEVCRKGLAWDREWCLVHKGTNVALSQKQYPRLALLRPTIDTGRRAMVVAYGVGSSRKEISISLDEPQVVESSSEACIAFKQSNSLVCGDEVSVLIYTQPEISEFFSEAVNVPCSLARYSGSDTNIRLAKPRKPRSTTMIDRVFPSQSPPIKLSNESPVLLISRSSVNRLNEQIRQYRSRPQEISPESFRANIIISEQNCDVAESPYAEDFWQHLTIGSGNAASTMTVLGPCQRCQMVCVDQFSAKRGQEPFSTLAKTRRWDGGVWFGIHLCLTGSSDDPLSTIQVGDAVIPC